MAIWDDVLNGQDREVYEALVQPRELGIRPAVIVIDVNYAFVGIKPEPLLQAIKTYPTACGEAGWQANPSDPNSHRSGARPRGADILQHRNHDSLSTGHTRNRSRLGAWWWETDTAAIAQRSGTRTSPPRQ